ncbi:MAG: MarR family transcriptional regulator [Solirubrobacterales bacterium]
MRERHGLSLREYEVLLQLWMADGWRLRRVDLAERLLITQGGVTRMLSVLERRGAVERESCEEDRRVVYARLTDQGAERLEAARADHLGEVDRLFTYRFDERDLSSLGELLGRLDPPGRHG